MNLNILRDETHQAMLTKGFWERPFNLGERLMLIVSEIGEAWDSRSDMRVGVKDSFPDEIVDVLIRMLDVAGFLQIDLSDFKWGVNLNELSIDVDNSLCTDCMNFVAAMSKILEADRHGEVIDDLYRTAFARLFCITHSFDFQAQYDFKSSFNAKRAHKHGKQY